MIQFITDLLIILVFQFIGVTARSLQHIGDIRKQSPSLPPNRVWGIIKEKDWDTYLGSGLILLLQLAIHTVMHIRGVELSGWLAAWWATMAIATVSGYGGQDIFFRWLGTSKQRAMEIAGGKKIETVIQQETPNETKTTTVTEETTPK